MGKKLGCLLGKNFKASKFKKLANLAISRIAFLEKQHRVRCSQAQSDVLQLLNLGQQERALLRVEHVMREQNMLDAYAMIESYFLLLMERAVAIQNNKDCPDELKEAISSLVFVASRCGVLPELQKFIKLFTKRFGKEFATRAVELHTECGVSPKFVKKLSTRQPSLESKLKVLKEIAPMNEITLNIGEASKITEPKKPDADMQKKQPGPDESANVNDLKPQHDMQGSPVGLKQDKKFYETMKEKKKYSNVESAAQAAFQLAAEAAATARIAVEFSRSPNKGPDDQSRFAQQIYVSQFGGSSSPKLQIDDWDATLKEKREWRNESDSVNFSSKPEGDKMPDSKYKNHLKEPEESNKKAELEKIISVLCSDSEGNTLSVKNMSSDIWSQNEQLEKERGFVREFESRKEHDDNQWFKHQDFNLDKLSLPANEYPKTSHSNAAVDKNVSSENKDDLNNRISKEYLPKSQAVPMALFVELGSKSTHHLSSKEQLDSDRSNIGRKPIPKRTRRANRL